MTGAGDDWHPMLALWEAAKAGCRAAILGTHYELNKSRAYLPCEVQAHDDARTAYLSPVLSDEERAAICSGRASLWREQHDRELGQLLSGDVNAFARQRCENPPPELLAYTQDYAHRPTKKTDARARCKAYLDFVRGRRCCNCPAPAPSEAHHDGPRGVGQKTSDFLTVPLCMLCHRAITGTVGKTAYLPRADGSKMPRDEARRFIVSTQERMIDRVLSKVPTEARVLSKAAVLAHLADEVVADAIQAVIDEERFGL